MPKEKVRMHNYNDVVKFLRDRDCAARSMGGWDDSFSMMELKQQLDGFYSCKFCGKPMYVADYERGAITMTCKTTLCPGNINKDMAEKLDYKKIQIKELTNQYLFDAMVKL